MIKMLFLVHVAIQVFILFFLHINAGNADRDVFCFLVSLGQCVTKSDNSNGKSRIDLLLGNDCSFRKAMASQWASYAASSYCKPSIFFSPTQDIYMGDKKHPSSNFWVHLWNSEHLKFHSLNNPPAQTFLYTLHDYSYRRHFSSVQLGKTMKLHKYSTNYFVRFNIGSGCESVSILFIDTTMLVSNSTYSNGQIRDSAMDADGSQVKSHIAVIDKMLQDATSEPSTWLLVVGYDAIISSGGDDDDVESELQNDLLSLLLRFQVHAYFAGQGSVSKHVIHGTMHHFTARSDPKIAALGADSTVEVAWLDTGHDVLGSVETQSVLRVSFSDANDGAKLLYSYYIINQNHSACRVITPQLRIGDESRRISVDSDIAIHVAAVLKNGTVGKKSRFRMHRNADEDDDDDGFVGDQTWPTLSPAPGPLKRTQSASSAGVVTMTIMAAGIVFVAVVCACHRQLRESNERVRPRKHFLKLDKRRRHTTRQPACTNENSFDENSSEAGEVIAQMYPSPPKSREGGGRRRLERSQAWLVEGEDGGAGDVRGDDGYNVKNRLSRTLSHSRGTFYTQPHRADKYSRIRAKENEDKAATRAVYNGDTSNSPLDLLTEFKHEIEEGNV